MRHETIASPARDIAFIFNNVSNHELLVAAFREDVEVHVLDAGADGLAQIAALLAGRAGIGALHIVGHGAPGTLQLGTLTLDSGNVNSYADVLGRIGAALAPDGDILLYGCDVAAGAVGAEFVGQVARTTRADVAASDDASGGEARGGDWTLEYRHGEVGGADGFDGAAVRSLDALLVLPAAGLKDVTNSMDVGTFVAGFDLSVLPGLTFVTNDDPDGIYFYSTASTATATMDATFTVSADTYNLGRFDLTNLGFIKYTGDPAGSYLFTVTGYKLDGTTVTTTFHNSVNQMGFDSAPNFSAMTGLKSFSVRIVAEKVGYPVSNYTFDSFTIANPLPNTHPTFVGTDAITAVQNGGAVDVAAALHVNDPDSYQTLTWSQDTAPAHGTLSFTSATSAGGSADVTPGGTITYTPAAGYVGSDTFKVKVTDGLTTIVRTVTVTVSPAAPSAPDLQAGSDSGLSTTDNITNATTLAFAGTGVAGDSTSTVRVFVDRNANGAYDAGDLTTTTTMSNGSWSLSLAAGALTDGTYNAYAQSTNGAATSAVSTPLSIKIDRTAPSVAITSNKASLKAGETATITFTFSEDPGASFALADVAVAGGTLSALGGSGTTRTATFTPTANTNETVATISIAANNYTDAAGNNGGVGTTPSLGFDTKVPAAPVSLTLTPGTDGGVLSDGRTNATTPVVAGSAEAGATIQLYGSDGTTVVGTGTAGGDGSFLVAASGLAEGTHTLTATATDARGNVSPASSAFTLVIDRTAPTLSITSNVATVRAHETATITFAFSEDPGSSFVHSDIAVTGGTLGALSGTGTTRTAVFTPTANASGTASISVVSGAYTDTAGNNGGAGTTPALTYDTFDQSVTITSDAASLKAGQTATITFTFSKDPGSSFVHGDINVTGGTLGPLSGTGLTRTATFTPANGVNGGTAVIDIPAGSYTDLDGNPGTAGAPRNITYDTLVPGAPAALTLATGSDSGVSNSDRVTQDTTPTVTGTADAGATVTLYDTDSTTVLGSATAAGDGSWSITATALAQGTHTLSAKAADAAGNVSSASGGLALTVDTIGPTLAITSDKAALKASETATITFTFSEDPGATFSWDGSAGDVVVSGGTLSALSGTGTVRTAVFTPNANTNTSTASITVTSGAYTDAAGNNGGAGATPGLTFDTRAPTVAITSNKSSLKAGDTATITFTFSEDPGASFTSDDVSVTGGTFTLDAGTGATRTAVFTPTASTNGGSASITIGSGLYTDAAGNAGAAGTTPSLAFDTAAPGVPTLALADGMDTGASATDHLTRIARPAFTGTAEAGSTVRLYANGTEIGSGTANGAGTWTITPSDLSAGAHFITAAATDAAGNTGPATAAMGYTVYIDTSTPTVSISSSQAALKAGDTATITFAFSEDPGDSFTLADVTVSGGALGPLAGTGNTRTALFTPAAGSNGPTATIAVGTATFADGAGNDNDTLSTLNLGIDTRAPAVAVTSSAPTLKAGETATITFTFDEAPVGFTIGDIVATGGTVSGLAGTGTTRTVTFTPTDAVNGGTGSIKVNAGTYTDAQGNAGAAGEVNLTYDTAVPGAPAALALAAGSDSGSSAGDRLTNVTRPTINGTAEAGATVKLYDGATEIASTTADSGGNWSVTLGADFATGLHSITAKAFDAANNGSPASAALAVTVDSTAPAAPAALSLSAGSDSGSSPADGVTSVARPTIAGTAEAGATVRLYDGAAEIGSATADGAGNWSFTPSADLSAGAHSLTARATDAAGNTSAASTTLGVTIDTDAPAAPLDLALSAGSDSGSSSGDGLTNVVRPAIRGTAEAGASVKLYDGATEIGSATADGAGNWSIALGADLSAGAHSLTAKATDAAGNASGASATFAVTIDTTTPGAPAALALTAGSDSGSSASDRLTNVVRPTFNGTAEAGATVKLYDGATEIASTTADGSGNWSVTLDADLASGARSITAKAFDAAGNGSAASAALVVAVDATAPSAPASLSLAAGGDSGSSPADGLTNVVRPTIRGSAEAGATVKVFDGATEIGSATADGAGNWSFTPAADLATGTHSISARAVDAAGNVGAASATLGVSIDTAPPAAPSELALAAGSDSGRSPADGLTNVSRPTINGKAEAGAAVKLYDGATEIGSATADGAGNWSIALGADLSTGAHSITAKATDAAGNASGASATLGVTIDTTAPTVTIERDKPAVKAGETAVVTFRFSEDPGPGFTAGSISVSGGTLEDLSTSGAVRTATFRAAAGANGTATIAVAADKYSDAAGNPGASAASLDIAFHTVIPTVTVTSSKAALAAGETATITFAFSEDPGASFTWDGSAGDLTVTGGTLSAISGSGLTRTAIFTPMPDTDGGNAVIAVSGSYTSPWGNEGLKHQASLSFDTRAPSAPPAPVLAAGNDSGASASDNVTRVTAPTVAGTAEAGATVKLYDGASLVGTGTADAGGNWSITTTTLAEGTHSITATATDAAGNVGSKSAALALTVDTTAPTLSIGASKPTLAYGETATITFTFSEDPGSSFAWDGTSGDIVVSGGTLSAISGTGTTRIATFTPHNGNNAGTASITVAAGSWADAAGNGGGNAAAPAIHFDTLKPTVAIMSDKAALKAGETAVVTFTFSEDPGASFDAADIAVSGGTLGALSGSGTTRSAVFTPTSDTNGGSAAIGVAALSYADAAGNGGAAGAAATIAFDTKAPAAPAALALAASSDTGASSSDGITKASSLVFQGTAEEGAVVTLVDAATNAVLGTAITAGGTWSVNLAGVAEGAITVAAFAQDAAGNRGPLSAPATVTVDRTALGAPSVGQGEGARLPVTGLADGASWEYSTDNGGHWQKGSGSTIVLPADGGYTVLARQVDVAGNVSAASTPLLVSLDTTAPTVQVGLSDRELGKGETATVTFTFSEAVIGFDLGDISAGNAGVSQLATSDGGRTWSAQLTPAAGVVSNSNVVRVNNAGVRDLAGNAGVGNSSSPNYTVNSAGLGATIELSDHDLAAGETALVIIRFSEPVNGFSLSDLSVDNGKLSQLASGDGGRTWVAVLTPSANVADATNQLVIDNSGVSTANGTRGEGTTVSANFAVSTVRPTAAVSLADHLLAPGASTTVTIRFSEAVTGLDMSDLSTTSGTLANLASTDGGMTWTVQLTAGSGGKAAQPGFVALDMGGLRNGAGNAGQGKVAVQFVQVAGPAQVGNVDGVSVISQSLADPVTGRVEQVMTVTEVTAGRQDDPHTPNAGLADIPIGTPNGANLTASLPNGAGLQVSGPAAPLNGTDGLLDLIRRIEGATTSGSTDRTEMSGHGQNFLAGAGGETTVETKTLVPTAAPGATLGQPIVIGGTPPKPGGPAAPAVGLVIDGRALPSGSTLQLENVDFAAVAGDLRVFGGSGRNYVVGDGGTQVIYLGAEDDVLSGGGGNDFIGSAGGDDRLDGGDGNDLVAGGIGNDLAAGGTGNDVVMGGRSVAGDWQFYVSGGVLSARHGGAVFSATGSEIVQAGELDAALPVLRFLQAGAQKVLDVALLYAALGRTPDLAGLSFWTQSGVSLKQVAAGVLASAEFDGGALGQTSDTVFVRGMYEHVLGRAASDADVQFWTAQLAGGSAAPASRADVLMAVALSDEHRKQVLGADGYLVGQASVAREAAWFGGSGDDRLDGGAGNDYLVGGDGVDTALYQGGRAQYRVLLGPDNSARVLDTASGDIDTLSGVEKAQFKDGTLELGFLGADTAQLARVGMLYQAVLDRTQDAAGLTWWLSLGMGASQLAQAFTSSPEFLARFGGVSDAAFVQALYANSGLDASAAGGMQSWQAYLGQHTRAELVAAWIAQDDVVHAQYGTSGLWLV